MIALTCVFTIRTGFTFFERLATPIVAFRGWNGFACATAHTVHLAGLRCSVTRFQRLLGYMLTGISHDDLLSGHKRGQA